MKGKEDYRIIFMGTPNFAIPSLKQIHKSAFNLVAVITATDKYGGRGKKTKIESPVKKYALEHGIPVLQPKNLKSKEFQDKLASFQADLQLVVAFRMLPVAVWDIPPEGTINLHASLLPKYRGAAPIHWAIINGEKKTGLTTFKLKHQIDTGDLIDQVEIPIKQNDTMGSIAKQMAEKGANLLLSTTEKVFSNQVEYKAQDLTQEQPNAPKIYFEDAKIDFNTSTQSAYNFIRGMNPFPGAWTKIDGKIVKIFDCKPIFLNSTQDAGKIILKEDKLFISTKDGMINAIRLQIEGKKKMETIKWLNGYRIQNRRVDT
jgi:methionyl-tRNA formyltransferase